MAKPTAKDIKATKDVTGPDPNNPKTTTTVKQGTDVQTELDDIQTKLSPKSDIRVMDPQLTDNIETENKPISPAPGTKAPNRFTVIVPAETTVLSLGESTKDASRTMEPGIRGETDTHVHFRARQPDTLVRLGTKGGHSTDTLAEAGYLVHTDGSAKQESIASHTVQSLGSNLLLHSKGAGPSHGSHGAQPAPPPATFASLQSDKGFVEVVAGDQSTIAAGHKVVIAADHALEPEHVEHGEGFAGQTSNRTLSTWMKLGLNLADTAASIDSMVRAFVPVSQGAEDIIVDWKTSPSKDWPKFSVDSAKLVSSLYRLAAEWNLAPSGSKVGVYSSGTVSIAGHLSASVYGGLSASVSSVLSASLLGGTASVKGLGYTSVWAGKEVSIKSRHDAKLEGERGKASVKGQKSVEVSSFKGPVIVQGKGDVRLASVEGQAYVYGPAGVYCGGGEDAGYGLQASGSQLTLGLIAKNASILKQTEFNREKAIFMHKDSIEIVFGKASVVLENDHVIITGKGGAAFKIDDKGNIDMDGSNIFLL